MRERERAAAATAATRGRPCFRSSGRGTQIKTRDRARAARAPAGPRTPRTAPRACQTRRPPPRWPRGRPRTRTRRAPRPGARTRPRTPRATACGGPVRRFVIVSFRAFVFVFVFGRCLRGVFLGGGIVRYVLHRSLCVGIQRTRKTKKAQAGERIRRGRAGARPKKRSKKKSANADTLTRIGPSQLTKVHSSHRDSAVASSTLRHHTG